MPELMRIALGMRNLAVELQRLAIRPDQAADVLDTLTHQLEKWIKEEDQNGLR